MAAIAAAILLAFFGALYFITHHKKEEIDALPGHKVTGNGLPPKPEERWRYIKDLENRQPGVRAPTEPTAGGEVTNQSHLTNEQRQLLEQMQADMRQQPTQLNEVPWNEKTPAQRQKQIVQQTQPAQQQQWNTQTQQARVQQRAAEQPYQPPRNTQQTTQPYQDLLKTLPYSQQKLPQHEAQLAPITREQEVAKQAPASQEKKEEKRWMVQCGSFKDSALAETVRAQLAFEGFDSRITTNNCWNRIVIGPIKGKDNADSTINRLKMAGHTSCIRLATGG